MTGLPSDVQHIDGSDASGKERLMSITPRCVHEETAFVSTNGLGESCGTLLLNDVSPSLLVRLCAIDLLASRVIEDRLDYFTLKLRLADLALDLTAIDCKVT